MEFRPFRWLWLASRHRSHSYIDAITNPQPRDQPMIDRIRRLFGPQPYVERVPAWTWRDVPGLEHLEAPVVAVGESQPRSVSQDDAAVRGVP